MDQYLVTVRLVVDADSYDAARDVFATDYLHNDPDVILAVADFDLITPDTQEV